MTHVNAAVRFVAITSSHSSRFMRSISWSRAMPALFTRTSMRPWRVSTASTSASTECASVTSSDAVSALPPAFRMRLNRGRGVVSSRGGHDVRAARGQHLRDAASDAAGRTRDNHDLLTQIEHAAMTASSSSGDAKWMMRASG